MSDSTEETGDDNMDIIHSIPVDIEPFRINPIDRFMYLNRMNTDRGIVYRLGMHIGITNDFRVPTETYMRMYEDYEDDIDINDLSKMISTEIMNYGNELLVYSSKHKIYDLLIGEIMEHILHSNKAVRDLKPYGTVDVICDRNIPDDVMLVSPATLYKIRTHSPFCMPLY